jgi:hypothetical protein
VLLQFLVMEIKPVTSVIQEPYQHHIDLKGNGKWNLRTRVKKLVSHPAHFGPVVLETAMMPLWVARVSAERLRGGSLSHHRKQ